MAEQGARGCLTVSLFAAGYPRNPYNDIVCNDTIAASGVFTAKELFRLSKCEFGTYRSELSLTDRTTTLHCNRRYFPFPPFCLLRPPLAGVESGGARKPQRKFTTH